MNLVGLVNKVIFVWAGRALKRKCHLGLSGVKSLVFMGVLAGVSIGLSACGRPGDLKLPDSTVQDNSSQVPVATSPEESKPQVDTGAQE